MISRDELAAKIRAWCAEFSEISSDQEGLPAFLAARLAESGTISTTDDQDVILGRFRGQVRRLRVRGRQPGTGFIHVELADGGVGFGIVSVADVSADQNRKLADIMDRLEGTR